MELASGEAGFRGGLLHDAERNRSAPRSVFYRIGDKVQQHLVEPDFVAEHKIVADSLRIHGELVAFRHDVGADDVLQDLKNLLQRLHSLLHFDSPGFYAAHFQHIVDQR